MNLEETIRQVIRERLPELALHVSKYAMLGGEYPLNRIASDLARSVAAIPGLTIQGPLTTKGDSDGSSTPR